MWMIYHQKTMVPNTRMVSVSEAKGWAYEIVKKRETNWALFPGANGVFTASFYPRQHCFNPRDIALGKDV